MSFFGSDGLEHQVKHLKQQSANKGESFSGAVGRFVD